jgi:hypothetical protein
MALFESPHRVADLLQWHLECELRPLLACVRRGECLTWMLDY